MHAVGHVLPWAALLWLGAVWLGGGAVDWRAIAVAAGACGIQLFQRIVLAQRLRTSFLGAVFHPNGVILMTCIQWHRYWLHLTGRRSWRGRVATTAGPAT